MTGGPGPYRRYEVLHKPADLAAWAQRSRLAPTPVLTIDQAQVADARRLRDALFGVVVARIHREPHPPADVEALNEAAARSALAPALASTGRREWAEPPTALSCWPPSRATP